VDKKKALSIVLQRMPMQFLNSSENTSVMLRFSLKKYNSLCCQLLANDFSQIARKIRPLAKNFGRSHCLFIEAILLKTSATK
jgi:hypothetical protein